MANPQYTAADANAEAPFYDLDAFEEMDGVDEVEEAPAKRGSKVSAEGAARRQLEERREAQRLRRLLSDYAWDDHDI